MLSIIYTTLERIIPGFNDGMPSAKDQLESNARVLSYMAGRKWGVCVNTVSSWPLKLHAASTSGEEAKKKVFNEYAIDQLKDNVPLALAQDLCNEDVSNAGLFLCSGLQRCVTGAEFERWERCSGACGVQQQQQHDLVDGTIAWLTLLKYNKIHTYIINIASW